MAVIRATLAAGPSQGFAVLFGYGLISQLAYVLAQGGQLAEAEAALREAKALLPLVSRWAFVNHGYNAQVSEAVIALARRDWAAAQAALVPLIALLKDIGPVAPLSEALRLHGQALAGAGAPEAEAVFQQAVKTAEHYGQRPAAWRAWQALAAWQTAHGQPAAAAESLAQARTHLRFIESSLTTPEQRAAFRDLPDVRAVIHSEAQE